jgi:putative ABC transport system permease protein
MHGLTGSLLHAWRSVLRQRRRTAIAAGAIAFGVCALILAGAFIEWIFWATREGTIQSGLGHIHVARQGFHQGGGADLDRFRLPGDDPILGALQAHADVRTVAPRLAFSGLASKGETTISFLGEGVDPQAESNFGEAKIIVQGEPLDAEAPREIIVGHGLAENLGARVGDTLVLLTNLPGGGVSAVEARVRGLFATVSKAYDDSVIRVPLPLAAELTRSPGAHRLVLVLKDTAATAGVLADLRARFGAQGYEFKPWFELADFYVKTRDLLSRQMDVMFAIIGVIIVLTISNSMMMGVMERTAEIGTAMALGTRRLGVLLQFLGEGALLGAVGGLAGAAIGVVLAAVISLIGIPMPPPPGQEREFTAEMIVTAPLVTQAVVLAIVTALVAAAYPAWKASRTPIVDALRAGR